MRSLSSRRGTLIVAVALPAALFAAAIGQAAPRDEAPNAANHDIARTKADERSAGDGADSDLLVLRRRILAPLLKTPDVDEARTFLDSIQPNGSWTDIDYKSQRLAGWPVLDHLRRLLNLTRAYKSPQSELHDDPRLRKAVFAALDFWLQHDLQCPNWWSNRIGGPQLLAPVLLLLDGELNERQRAKGLEIVRRATLRGTGQNLIWVADVTVTRGVLENQPEVVENAYRRIAGEVRVHAKGEGIQADYSFHQHGPCFYSHGYGAFFGADVARLAAQARGTRFALPNESVKAFSDLILDGHQWFVRGSTADHGAVGRQITRQDNSVAYLGDVAENMLRLPTGREAEFRELARRIAGDPGVALVGNRHFWRSDVMSHRRPAYAASVRMFSTRTNNTDAPCNSEGIKSHHLGDGCNLLFRTGQEYVDIFPVWDWKKIPGTTVEQTPELEGDVRRRGNRDFVGGVSDGEYGVAAFDLVRDAMRARKAWFFFDREYVCLGAGVWCDSDHPIATTVNQCLLVGEVVVGGEDAPRTLEPGERRLDVPAWVWHDSVGYVFPGPAALGLANRSQSGSWRLINHRYPDEPVSRDVFTLWIDHGSRPRDAKYCYIVAPDASVDDLVGGRVAREATVLLNGASLQAVRHDGQKTTGAVFHEPGSLAVTKDLTIVVDQPCLVLLREEKSRLAISVSNPKNEPLRVGVEARLAGSGKPNDKTPRSQSVFSLPGGPMAGSSVTQRIVWPPAAEANAPTKGRR